MKKNNVSKKTLSILLSFILTASSAFFFCFSASAASDGTYLYELDADGTIILTGYTGPGGDITLPAVIDGKPVTSIGDWFMPNYYSADPANIKSVIVPSGIKHIGKSAFSSCENMTNISLPETLETIGVDAFAYCMALESVEIPQSVRTLEEGAFAVCSSLKTITLNEGLQSIGAYAFLNCGALRSLVIPNSVTKMEEEALSMCLSLNEISIGSGLNPVNDDVFGTDVSIIGQLTLVKGYAKTGAEAFAKKHGIPFETLGNTESTLIYNAYEITQTDISIGKYSIETVENQAYQAYYNYANPDRYYYYIDADGNFNAAVYDRYTHKMHFYTYTPDTYKFLRHREIPLDLDSFGGFYAAPDQNLYIVTGQENHTEEKNKTVIRVRKYSMDLKSLGSADIKGGVSNLFEGIYEPFAGGICSMDMNGSILTMHTSREMFTQPGETVQHQTSITFYLNTQTMTFDFTRGMPFVSHSFAQYVKTNGNQTAFIDHGDATPRSVVFHLYENGTLSKSLDLFELNGSWGENYTGTTVDSFDTGKNGYLVTGASLPHNNAIQGVTGYTQGLRHNIYLISVAKDGSKSTFKWLTENIPNLSLKEVGEPRTVKIDDDTFAVMFDEYTLKDGNAVNHTLRVLFVNSKGDLLSSEAYDGLWFKSNSQPIYQNGKLVWISSIQKGVNKLYSIPASYTKIPLLLGDTNRDGKVNILDVTSIQYYLAGGESFDELQKLCADTNKDGKITIEDATEIQLYLSGSKNIFGIGAEIQR